MVYNKKELEDMLCPIAEKIHPDNCQTGEDIVKVTLPWLDADNDCVEVYIIRDKDGKIRMSQE